MNFIHQNICRNDSAGSKRMTEDQLMLLLELVSEYDFNLPDMSKWTVKMASQAIDTILWHKERGTVKLRRKPYDVKDVLKRFRRKYPELYNVIHKDR